MHVLKLNLLLAKSVYFQNMTEVHSREQGLTVITWSYLQLQTPATTTTANIPRQVTTYPRLRHSWWWPTDTLKEQAVDHIRAVSDSCWPLKRDSEGAERPCQRDAHRGFSQSSSRSFRSIQGSKLDWPIHTQVISLCKQTLQWSGWPFNSCFSAQL